MQWQQGEAQRDKGERSKVQKISFAEDRLQRESAEMLSIAIHKTGSNVGSILS